MNADAPTRGKYPWTNWTDGEPHTIYRGEDYRISTYNMQVSLHGRARKQGLTVTSRSFTRPQVRPIGYVWIAEGLTFQFHEVEDV